MLKALQNKDSEKFLDLIHRDFVMVSHQTRTTRDKHEFVSMVKLMMSSESLTFTEQRCLYENDDILVEHSFISFPDKTSEAVLAVWTKEDNKFIRVETGATKIDDLS